MCDSKTGSDSEVLPNESDGVSLLEEHEPMDIESRYFSIFQCSVRFPSYFMYLFFQLHTKTKQLRFL